ncbi:MAG TPA: phosphoribosyltransferase family protein [Gemmatimonadales bacterium]|jgi:predicted phosphoribosyltransferase|nr:phosphoribosyltransferase family protein [Gemmatimonadales bacterium]
MLGDPRFLYADRADAAHQLARELLHLKGERPLVLGIPRGGVPIACIVAEVLGGDVDAIVAAKIRAPGAPELAIGAVTAGGTRVLAGEVILGIRASKAHIEAATAEAHDRAARREALLRDRVPALPYRGRVVVVCDDGLATGSTMRAAVRAAKGGGAARVVVAVPVGSEGACAALALEGDEVVCPERPEPFYAVGQAYQDFGEVSDEAMISALERARGQRSAPAPAAR